MSDSRNTLSEWLQFLLDAGIPASQAANYAVSFVENRIERNMLGELNKEYLKDLGINVLGDIICILKHAKKIAAQQSKRNEIQIVRTADGIKKSTPTSRLVDHFLKPSGSNSAQNSPKPADTESESEEEEQEPVYQPRQTLVPTANKLRSEGAIRVSATALRSAERGAAAVRAVSKTQKTQKSAPAVTSSESHTQASRRRVAPPIVITDKLKEEVPVQKKRRVLPEHEGRYKITMPSGKTPKTAKLIAQGDQEESSAHDVEIICKLPNKTSTPVASKGVFSRLGSSSEDRDITIESAMSGAVRVTKSNTIIAKTNKDKSTSFTVTGLGKVDPDKVFNSMKTSTPAEKGVFGRLGGSSTPSSTRRAIKRPATSTQPDEPIALDAAPYIGVLKDGGVHAKPKSRLKQAPQATDKIGFAVSRLATENVRTRLGGGQSGGITRTISTSSTSSPRTSVVSVKRRLGGADESTVSSSTDRSNSTIRLTAKSRDRPNRKQTLTESKGVFSRLGSK